MLSQREVVASQLTRYGCYNPRSITPVLYHFAFNLDETALQLSLESNIGLYRRRDYRRNRSMDRFLALCHTIVSKAM